MFNRKCVMILCTFVKCESDKFLLLSVYSYIVI